MINYVRDQESKVYYNPDPKYYNTFYNSWANILNLYIFDLTFKKVKKLNLNLTANKQTKLKKN